MKRQRKRLWCGPGMLNFTKDNQEIHKEVQRAIRKITKKWVGKVDSHDLQLAISNAAHLEVSFSTMRFACSDNKGD